MVKGSSCQLQTSGTWIKSLRLVSGLESLCHFPFSIAVIYDFKSPLAIIQAILQKASGALKSSLQGSQKVGKSETSINQGSIYPVSNGTQKSGPTEIQDLAKVQISRAFDIPLHFISLCLWLEKLVKDCVLPILCILVKSSIHSYFVCNLSFIITINEYYLPRNFGSHLIVIGLRLEHLFGSNSCAKLWFFRRISCPLFYMRSFIFSFFFLVFYQKINK